MPFNETPVLEFWETLLKAHQDSGDAGFVTIDAMKNHFNNDTWSHALADPNSKTRQVLASPALKHSHTNNHIDFTALAVHGCLLCHGLVFDKVNVMECIVHEGPQPNFIHP